MNDYETYRRLTELRNNFDMPIECDDQEPACDFCGKKACPGDCRESLTAAAEEDYDEQGRWS